MARFRLTIDFDDTLSDSDGPLYAELAASGAVHHLKNFDSITIEDSTLVDNEYVTDRRGLTVDWLEWCERDEANEAPSWL